MPVDRIVPPHAVDRPELLSRLDVGMDAPLTLIVAPAGSGKTVLLTQWAATVGEGRVGWLDMSSADDDAVHFVRRLVAELASLDPALAGLDGPLSTVGEGLGDALLELIAVTLAEVPHKIVMIFDDLHRVSNREIVTDLWRLADLLPPNTHFVFSSRVDLQLGWSRHRLQHGLVELRQAELAFDRDTGGRVLERILRRPVDPATVATIVERTEGWAAGIQLTALSLRFRSDPDELVDALAESDRLAIDYLSEEVLDAQSARRRRALLQLSVLDEISPGLVEVVGGIDEGASFLRDLENESMFVVAVAGRPDHYRFHHLFRDLLRYRLRASDSEAEPELLTAAAGWHSARGDAAAAIECLLAARRWDRALDLILLRGRDVYERGETATVARWLSLVPPRDRSARIDAELLYGILEGMSGHAATAEEVFRGMLADRGLPVGHRLVVLAYLAAAVQFRPHPEVYLDAGRRALELLEEAGDASMPDVIHMTDRGLVTSLGLASVGRAHFYLGDVTAAREWLERALESSGGTYGPFRVHILGSLALVHAWQGRLTRAAELADEALALATELALLGHPSPADAYLAKALIAIQRGEPEAGAFALHEGHLRAASNGRVQLLWIAHALSRLVDPDGTDAAAMPPAGAAPPIVRTALRAIDHRRIRESGGSTPPSPETDWSGLSFEDVAGVLAAGDASAARARLQAMPGQEITSPAHTVERDILLSWLSDLEGRPSESRRLLSAALAAAEGEELIHPFLRAGAYIEGLLLAMPGQPTGFRRVILGRFTPSTHRQAGQLTEPLTARELELLAYLPSRLTNAELAARCFVSVNTVKTHMAHIYRKLDAGGRDAAIARARELGLLEVGDIARVG
ncbi:LuxR C-terminal-related transcriptional regulator [Microbacterium deminutum]|uniref:HTH luxR-type domain-containing protein n=1 Tax=Microbacterium deminutum TaxID=344164 RepID=A0ABN2QQ47_9MICO